MRTYDFTPLYRSTIGFDRLARLMENSAKLERASSEYPPYDIQAVDENSYRITMAVAGFSEQELDIETGENTLTVAGKHDDSDADVTYLHRGIAGRDFIRKFELADHMKVTDAHLVNGILSIDLYREVPEEMKPTHIVIKTSEPVGLPKKAKKLIENMSKRKSA
ncbi:MAG: Hsp20 family protein [Rhodospirillales bacterium]|nr:Hsp20 family protein [Rhodospirillales bacterium]